MSEISPVHTAVGREAKTCGGDIEHRTIFICGARCFVYEVLS